MSLKSRVLRNKTNTYSNHAGQTISDLQSLSYINPNIDYKYTTFVVSEKYIARPDLISIDYYGVSDYTDVICKLNGISNPFELNQGMIIELPDITYMDYFIFEGDEIEAIVTNRDMTIRNAMLAANKNASTKVTPNEGMIWDKNFNIDVENGIILY